MSQFMGTFIVTKFEKKYWVGWSDCWERFGVNCGVSQLALVPCRAQHNSSYGHFKLIAFNDENIARIANAVTITLYSRVTM